MISRVQRGRQFGPRIIAAFAAMLLAATILSTTAASAQTAAVTTASTPHAYTQADVEFVQGMILHHAQAVVMSDWAPTHGASPSLVILCKRIALSQRDEIVMMQNWLEERKLAVPDPLHMLPSDAARMNGMNPTDSGMASKAGMPGMPVMSMNDHAMMPGMLTQAQLGELNAAHGAEFDRLYLTGMIRHHQGALHMVAKLFDTPGGGQQPEVFSFATDVDAGQRVEMARMQAMLNTLNSSQTR
ncbi:MAG: DUF305 domain-containing protein [Gemmatimonadota bacterium]|nr:DUF305 domain-containing protein [Gemmatimonadota bacterium]